MAAYREIQDIKFPVVVKYADTGNAPEAADFNQEATREQLRGYLAVLDLLDEFHADCLGWQYQLGLLNLLPPSDFAEGLLNSHARPEGNGQGGRGLRPRGSQGSAIPAGADATSPINRPVRMQQARRPRARRRRSGQQAGR